MTKKHKAKGNQQKPHKRKSPRDNFSRDSSGPPTPFFSLRDEAVNTERHHSDWSPLAKLRDRPVAFVSAGTIQPLDEPKVTEESPLSRPPETALQKELTRNEGAMADLNIESPRETSPEPYINVVMDVETTEAIVPSQVAPSADPQPSVSQDLFIIDTVGDQALKPNGPTPIVRDTTPDMESNSEDEVILFRGRRTPVTVRDDLLLVDNTTQEVSEGTATGPALSIANNTLVEPSSTIIETPPLTSKAPKTASGRRRKPGRHLNARRGQIQYDDPDVDDIDDDVMRDYLANVSGAEELIAAAKGGSPAEDDEDEWTSSDMSDEDSSGEAALEQAMLDIVFQRDSDENEDAYIDDEGTSDPGDDSDLESDLEYTARERWEDEEDLRQRQIDALTDEEIARILAKQEDLGMGSDEILLLDDSGFGDVARAQAGLDAILADPDHPLNPGRRKKKSSKSRPSGHFPSASLMADVVEQDPYGGFDVMDFERPSLRSNTKGRKGRKSAGPLPEELAGLSDSDLIDDLQSAWAKDRAKKSEKKAERAELRAQGLLGRKNKFKPDLAMKFSDGMSLDDLRETLDDFLSAPGDTQKAFPPMEKGERKLLHEIAHVFDLTSVSRGAGKSRFTVLSKRARTPTYLDERRWARATALSNRSFFKAAGKGRSGTGTPARAGRGGGFSKAAVGYANGDVVGAAAPEIADTSFGHKLMLKMGWEKGMALGKGGEGMLVPVEARVKSGRGGLGE